MSRTDRRDRARGVLLGQCVGDALGAQFEFSSAASLLERKLTVMEGGGPHQTLPGQVTDDSELALALARSIRFHGTYEIEDVSRRYLEWFHSHPFDCGNTTANALAQVDFGGPLSFQLRTNAQRSIQSQANGSLMRISPLGILFARWSSGVDTPGLPWESVASFESSLTHANPICSHACEAFTLAIAELINTPGDRANYYEAWNVAFDSVMRNGDEDLLELLRDASERPIPTGRSADGGEQGWVGIAFQNAFHQLLTAPSFREGIRRTILLGGDTDTNAAIAGALLGAAFGVGGIPPSWKEAVINCRSPRPKVYWANDVLELADNILIGRNGS